MSSKVKSKKEDKKSRLINAAYSLFVKKGNPDASVDEITKNANVAKGTFYLYFKDKRALVQEVVNTSTHKILLNAVEHAQRSECSDFVDRFIVFSDYLVDYFKTNKIIIKLIGRHFSWAKLYQEIELQENSVEINEIIDTCINSPYLCKYSRDEAIQILLIAIEMTVSLCYDSVTNDCADMLDTLKSTHHTVIRKILA